MKELDKAYKNLIQKAEWLLKHVNESAEIDDMGSIVYGRHLRLLSNAVGRAKKEVLFDKRQGNKRRKKDA